MGYYIQTGENKGKADYLVDELGAKRVPTWGIIPAFDQIDLEDKAIICVIDNGPFEAAALCYNRRELEAFALDLTGRPKEFLTLDKKTAYALAGYGK